MTSLDGVADRKAAKHITATERGRGFTLLELIVVVTLIGSTLLVASVSIGSAFEMGRDRSQSSRLARGRRQAVTSGQPVVVTADSALGGTPVLFLPDGRAVGPGVDPLTGRSTS